MIDRYADALRSLRAVWIDAGTRDEWFLDLGAEAFRAGLDRIGVPSDRIAFELFPAGARRHRLPLSARGDLARRAPAPRGRSNFSLTDTRPAWRLPRAALAGFAAPNRRTMQGLPLSR